MDMVDHFPTEVESIVGPLLSDLGFTLDNVDVHVDEGGRHGSVVYYKSADCKLQIYQSSREGSVNCMIAPLDAPNEFGPHDASFKWQYLTKFAPMPDVPLEELIETVSFETKTSAEELRWVRDNILKYYEAAHAGIHKQK
ncbi:hypothetical protein [Mycobacterium sp. IS-1556]|uniref:hypothetical protein n=1 Tax=Mycobacterium sp. IS-1556 TaxID=1772276 RepID=UPI00074161AB|nr:hypothetical protein [Mycobacterium sp. IS-1556]KUH84625.1 hypothetical protein AU187_18950 [Mycobacterium sp. IS-1556]